jgi:hypothetical protein
MSLQVAIDALEHDAQTWREIAGVTAGAAAAAGTLGLSETAMSFAADQTGLLDTYNALTVRAAGLLAEGADVHEGIAADLEQVAAAYEDDDQQAAQRLRDVWSAR